MTLVPENLFIYQRVLEDLGGKKLLVLAVDPPAAFYRLAVYDENPTWKWLQLVCTLTSVSSASWRLRASFSRQQRESARAKLLILGCPVAVGVSRIIIFPPCLKSSPTSSSCKESRGSLKFRPPQAASPHPQSPPALLSPSHGYGGGLYRLGSNVPRKTRWPTNKAESRENLSLETVKEFSRFLGEKRNLRGQRSEREARRRRNLP